MHLTRAFRHAGRFLAVLLSTVVLLACAHAQAQSAPALSTFGEQKTAVILVNFKDGASQPITPAAAHALVFGTVSDFYWEASYQKTFLSGNTYGWFTIPVSRTVCDVLLIAEEADKAASAAGVDLASFDRLVYVAPQNSCGATGYNNGPGVWPSRTWLITDSFDARLFAHEIGHNFGLSHSQALDCGATVLGSNCIKHSYGDAADTMGSGTMPHFNAFQKEKLGWLNAGVQPPITNVLASGTYAIAPLETIGTAAKALRIPRGVDAQSGQMSYYYVEYRQPIGFDATLGSVGNLANGLLLRTGGSNQSSMLLDMTPDSYAGSPSDDIVDSALAVGRTYVDSASGVSIKLLSADASGASIQVAFVDSAPTTRCIHAAPTLSIGGPTAAAVAGSTVTYTLSVRNNDNIACSATTYNLARSVPSGWAGALAANSLSLVPGATGNTTLSVTSSASAAAGGYTVGVGTSSSVGSTHTANASIIYTVTTSAAGTLSETVGTDKSIYLRGQIVYMSALVRDGGLPAYGASVRFNVALPAGGVAVLNATSGSDGYARATYKIGKSKAAIGSYLVRADANIANSSATATTGFSAR